MINEIEIDYKKKLKLPSKSGIYFVKWGGAVLYVGQAKNIKKRWQNHHISSHINKLWGRVIISYVLVDLHLLDAEENKFIQLFKPPYNIYSLSESIKEPTTYKEHIRHLIKILKEKHGSVESALEAVNIPRGHFYNVINPNRKTTSGNPFYAPIEWMVKLTRDGSDYCMLKKVVKDCGCILITPTDIKDLKDTDTDKAVSILQRILGIMGDQK